MSGSNSRDAFMVIACGYQGAGKTYYTNMVIKQYIKNKINTNHKARKVLVLDLNGEYEGFTKINYDTRIQDNRKRAAGILALTQKNKVGRFRIVGLRKNGQRMSTKEIIIAIETICEFYVNGLFVLEDINAYMPKARIPDSVYETLVRLRHVGVDVIIHYQGIGNAPPAIWANVKVLRLHKTLDSVTRNSVKDKVDEKFEIIRIAELIVREYIDKNIAQNPDAKYYACFCDLINYKILNTTKSVFRSSCEKYLYANASQVRILMSYEDKNGNKKFKRKYDAIQHLINEKEKEYLN